MFQALQDQVILSGFPILIEVSRSEAPLGGINWIDEIIIIDEYEFLMQSNFSNSSTVEREGGNRNYGRSRDECRVGNVVVVTVTQ